MELVLNSTQYFYTPNRYGHALELKQVSWLCLFSLHLMRVVVEKLFAQYIYHNTYCDAQLPAYRNDYRVFAVFSIALHLCYYALQHSFANKIYYTSLLLCHILCNYP